MPPQSSNAPPPATSLDSKELGAGDIYDLLKDDGKETIDLQEEETAEKPEETPTEDTEGEEDKGKDKKEEIKLVGEDEEEEKPQFDEDDLDIVAPARRKEILKKYPNVFKDFPHLEKAYYRDQEYNELFSTPSEAREMLQAARNLEQYSNRIQSGSTQEILKTVKDNNPDAFGKIVDNYLMSLKAVDDKAFFHVVGNTIKSTVGAMVKEAQRSQNEPLLEAARLLHQFVMGNSEWEAPTTFNQQKPVEETQQETQLQNERMQFFQERVDTVQTDLQSRVDGVLKNTIDQNIDPRNSMTGYVKKVAVSEVMDTVRKSIGTDSNFRRHLDRLWERAAEERFSKNSIEKIRSAYLSKAKTLLPDAIKKSRNEALRGLGKRVKEDVEERTDDRREKAAPQTLRGSNKSNPSKGKSTLAFFNED